MNTQSAGSKRLHAIAVIALAILLLFVVSKLQKGTPEDPNFNKEQSK